MKMLVTEEEVRKLAQLSYISLKQEDVTRLTKEIEEVLAYVSVLKNYTSGQEEHSLPQNINRLRDDISKEGDSELLLALAPEREDNYYVVPSILKQRV